MANLVERYKNWQKKTFSLYAGRLNSDTGVTSTDTEYILANIPEKCLVVRAEVYIVSAITAGTSDTIKLNVSGTDTVSIAADGTTGVIAAGGTNSDTQIFVETGGEIKLVLSSAMATLDAIIVVEYVEYDKTVGELTTV